MKKYYLLVIIILISVSTFSQSAVSLTQIEKDAILYMREEEKLARDVYDSMYVKWQVNPFGNIRLSEQNHMDRMRLLINTYLLTDPVEHNKDKPGIFTNRLFQKYYQELVGAAGNSFVDALKVGAKIEELDISDLEERIKQTNQTDIIRVYQFLIMASENHLRAFVRKLKMQGTNYNPTILSKSRFEQIIESESNMKHNLN